MKNIPTLRGVKMETYENQLDSKTVFDGRIIHVTVDTIELPNGKQSTREVVGHPGGVTVLPITDDNEVVLVSQYRYPYKEVILETPAGKLNPDEDIFLAAQRELREETGAVAKKYIDLGILYPSPGYCGEKIHLYAATGLEFFDQDLDDDEFLNVVKIPFDEVVDRILSGEIKDSKTQAVVLKFNEMRRRGEV